LELLPDTLAICRFAPDETVPAWANMARDFLAIVRTRGELSVTCAEDLVPPTLTASRDWRALELHGPFDHGLVGILVDIAAPLARAKVSIMPIATYDTDYVLVRGTQLALAVATLRAAGHIVLDGSERPG
jgi:hypothetical protein